MRKIVLCIRRTVGRSGGADRVLAETANYLALRGHEVELWHYDKKAGLPFYPIDPMVKIVALRRETAPRSFTSRVSSSVLKSTLPGGRLKREVQHRSYRKCLRARLMSSRPSIVIGYLVDCFPYLIEAARGLDIPVIASCHNVPAKDFADPSRWDPNPYDRRRRLSLLQEAAAVTVIHSEFADWFPEAIRNRIQVLENPVTSTPGRANVQENTRENTILAVGRLVKEKGHGDLIRSWSRIHKHAPHWKLRICGEGPFRTELEKLVIKHHLEGRVEIPGATTDIMKEYEHAKFLVTPSEFEGFGLVTAEAMLKGLPVIGFENCPGTNKIITDNVNGLLLPGKHREEELANSIKKLITDHNLRQNLSNMAPRTVQQYNPDIVFPKWESFIKETHTRYKQLSPDTEATQGNKT